MFRCYRLLDEKRIEDFLADKTYFEKLIEKGRIVVPLSEKQFTITMYLANNMQLKKPVHWQWVLKEFGIKEKVESSQLPSAILLIEEANHYYAVSFGNLFFLLDKYCDHDFAFAFGRKIKYKGIRTTALNNPGSKRNKTINSYIDYDQLTFDSGESYAKLKAKAEFPEKYSYLKSTIEIGTSIKFDLADNKTSLPILCDIISYIERTISTQPDLYLIPFFAKVREQATISKLENQLRVDMQNLSPRIDISEFDIIGTTEVFQSETDEYILTYKRKQSKKLSNLSSKDIKDFCAKHSISFAEHCLDVNVKFQKYGQEYKRSIKELLDYTNDEEKSLLSKGEWYRYNDDYVSTLNASISNIDAIYNPQYDCTEASLKEFGNTLKTSKEDKSKISLYREYLYNTQRAKLDGFELRDRGIIRLAGYPVEKMDLYKDGTAFSVKFGNSSGKLTYVIDQSLATLDLYKQRKLDEHKIERLGIWIILTNHSHIEDEGGTPHLEKLNMLMLKNKLDDWKKKVLLAGLKPVIYINYMTETR